MDSCTSIGVERNTAIYAPASHLMGLFLLRRISASSRAGTTASSTETTASSNVYSMPRTKAVPYLGKKEKLKKSDGRMFSNRLLHHMASVSFHSARKCKAVFSRLCTSRQVGKVGSLISSL